METALPLKLGVPTRGRACYGKDGMRSYFWRTTGHFVASDWFRLRVFFENGADARDVDFTPVVRNSAGQPVAFDALGTCSNGPGENEDCAGLLMRSSRAVYVEAHALSDNEEAFHVILEKTSAPLPARHRHRH